MENQPQIEKGKVSTDEQIKRIGKRLVERAVRLDSEIRNTNQLGPDAGPLHEKSDVTNVIHIDTYSDSLSHDVRGTGPDQRTVIEPEYGTLSATVTPLDGKGEYPSRIKVDEDGNHLYIPSKLNESSETEHQMDDAELRQTAAEALNRVRNELNRRA
jgi:hypothetical protein